ncbi:hypothetical protein P9112_001043 [Eukaryota sp. TZLM1-RC]
MDVSQTSFDAASAKLSASTVGYFPDPYLPHLVPTDKRRRYDPVMHRGYYLRVHLVRYCIDQFIQRYPQHKIQIVNVGCGVDSLFLHYLLDPSFSNLTWLELDLPSIVKEKCTSIIKHWKNELQLVKSRSVYGRELHGPRYHLISGDITASESLTHCLSFIDHQQPTLFLFECVVTYLDPDNMNDSLSKISEQFQKCYCFLYDPFRSHTTFGTIMLRNISARVSSSCPSLQRYKTLVDFKQRMCNVGFKWVVAGDLLTMEKSVVDEKEIARLLKLEPFAEVEEYQMLLSHYCVIVAGNDLDNGLITFGLEQVSLMDDKPGYSIC